MKYFSLVLTALFAILVATACATPKVTSNAHTYGVQDAEWQKLEFGSKTNSISDQKARELGSRLNQVMQEDNDSVDVSLYTVLTCKGAEDMPPGSKTDEWRHYCRYLICHDRLARHGSSELCDREYFGDAQPAPPQ